MIVCYVRRDKDDLSNESFYGTMVHYENAYGGLGDDVEEWSKAYTLFADAARDDEVVQVVLKNDNDKPDEGIEFKSHMNVQGAVLQYECGNVVIFAEDMETVYIEVGGKTLPDFNVKTWVVGVEGEGDLRPGEYNTLVEAFVAASALVTTPAA